MDRPQASSIWRRFRGAPAAALLGLALAAPCPSVQAAPLTNVFVNGSRVEAYPVFKDGVAYLPIHSMATALEVSIVYDHRLNLIKVDGAVSGASPYLADGRVYLPVEAFVQTLGGHVTFDGKERAIRVQTGGGAPAVASRSPAVTLPQAALSPSGVGAPAPSFAAPVAAPIRPAASQPGYPQAYSPNTNAPSGRLRPVSAPPVMPGNLSLPQSGTGVGRDAVGYAPMPANATPVTDGGVYVPRSSQNQTFQVTVTNLETVEVIKDFYRPRTGYKFVVVYLSQQNVSEEVQIYTGRFSLLDQRSASYDYIEGLSNFWLVILRPFGINFGYLVFEVPRDAKPMSVVLHALNQAPLSLNL